MGKADKTNLRHGSLACHTKPCTCGEIYAQGLTGEWYPSSFCIPRGPPNLYYSEFPRLARWIPTELLLTSPHCADWRPTNIVRWSYDRPAFAVASAILPIYPSYDHPAKRSTRRSDPLCTDQIDGLGGSIYWPYKLRYYDQGSGDTGGCLVCLRAFKSISPHLTIW